jgi:hypothetical protein
LRRRYQEALAILREISARPEIARCLAGLGRIAMDQGDIALGRQHLTESIELSRSIGSRIGTIWGLGEDVPGGGGPGGPAAGDGARPADAGGGQPGRPAS